MKVVLLICVSLALAGCGTNSKPVSSPEPTSVESENQRLARVVNEGASLVEKGQSPDQVLSILGEPSVRDMSDAEMIDGEYETLTCWLYQHPDNPTEQDRSLQVCFRVNPKKGGRLYWARRQVGASK